MHLIMMSVYVLAPLDAGEDKDVERVFKRKRMMTKACWLTSLTCKEGPQQQGTVDNSRDWMLAGLGFA